MPEIKKSSFEYLFIHELSDIYCADKEIIDAIAADITMTRDRP
jgi:ferritin-like metal-binding protein YciE